MSVLEAVQALALWPFIVMAATGLAFWRPNR